jgi:hypothetical protein
MNEEADYIESVLYAVGIPGMMLRKREHFFIENPRQPYKVTFSIESRKPVKEPCDE